MKFTAPLTFLAAAGAASAWKLEIWSTSNQHVTMHGTTNSGCVNIDFGAMSINHAKFQDSLFADTFELYQGLNCATLKYRNGDGDHKFNTYTIRSYKVY